MTKETDQETILYVRRIYDEGCSMRKIGMIIERSPVWVRKLLMKTGGTRPRGFNLTAKYRADNKPDPAVSK